MTSTGSRADRAASTSATIPGRGRPWCSCTAFRTISASTTISSRTSPPPGAASWPSTSWASAHPTSRPAPPTASPQQLGDLEAVVQGLNLGKVVLVVHDSSGIVGLNFAIAHPGKVAGLCILNSAFDASPAAHWPEMIILFGDPELAALAQLFATSPAQFGWLLQWQQGRLAVGLSPAQRAHFEDFIGPLIARNFIDAPSAAPAFMQMTAQFYAELARNSGRLDLLAALEMPVKVIWGTADPYLATPMGEERATRFRHGTFHPVPAGHWLQSDEPALVAQEILS
jgi:haloalkane dehalogenase